MYRNPPRKISELCVKLKQTFLEDLWWKLSSQSPRALTTKAIRNAQESQLILFDVTENWCAKCFTQFGSINPTFPLWVFYLNQSEDVTELFNLPCSSDLMSDEFERNFSCHTLFTCFMWLNSWLIIFIHESHALHLFECGIMVLRHNGLHVYSAHQLMLTGSMWWLLLFSFAAVKWWRHYNELKALYLSDIIPDHVIAWLS